ncbi:MAG: glycosyltransferase family 1 protein, partial [Cyanobacteria bacterium P01_C01_bin.118]
MRKLYFLLPGTTRSFYCGGLFAELNTLQLAQQICEAEVVTYRQREENYSFIDDLLRQGDLNRYIFVVSWGFDVPKYLKKLAHCNVMYHAHSSGYGFSVPPQVPILSVSRNTMGYWGMRSHNSLLYWLPNQLPADVTNRQVERDI